MSRGKYTKYSSGYVKSGLGQADRTMTQFLRETPLRVHPDELAELVREVQQDVTWRKVSPYFAELFVAADDNFGPNAPNEVYDETTGFPDLGASFDMVMDALIEWIIHQLWGWWADAPDDARIEVE